MPTSVYDVPLLTDVRVGGGAGGGGGLPAVGPAVVGGRARPGHVGLVAGGGGGDVAALPGVSYAFVWPLLAILAGQAVAFLTAPGRVGRLAASWLAAVPLLVIHHDDPARPVRRLNICG